MICPYCNATVLSTSQPIKEATAAQHFDRPKGEPARFVRNGILETCQCRDCAALTATPAVGGEARDALNEIRTIALGGWSNHYDQDFGTKDDEYKFDCIREQVDIAIASEPNDLLRRARQFVADAGCDEDDHDVNLARDELLAEIDAALRAQPASPLRGSALSASPPEQPAPMKEIKVMTDLLPCPFCGTEPALINEGDFYSVACPHYYCNFSQIALRSEKRAIERWNTRAQPALPNKDPSR